MSADLDPATDPDPTTVIQLGPPAGTAVSGAPVAAPPARPGAGDETTIEYAVVQFDGGPERPVSSVVAGFCDVHAADEHAAEQGYGDYVVAPATMIHPA